AGGGGAGGDGAPVGRVAGILEGLVFLRDRQGIGLVEQVGGADVVPHERVVAVRASRQRRVEARIGLLVGEELPASARTAVVAGGALGRRIVEYPPPPLRRR